MFGWFGLLSSDTRSPELPDIYILLSVSAATSQLGQSISHPSPSPPPPSPSCSLCSVTPALSTPPPSPQAVTTRLNAVDHHSSDCLSAFLDTGEQRIGRSMSWWERAAADWDPSDEASKSGAGTVTTAPAVAWFCFCVSLGDDCMLLLKAYLPSSNDCVSSGAQLKYQWQGHASGLSSGTTTTVV